MFQNRKYYDVSRTKDTKPLLLQTAETKSCVVYVCMRVKTARRFRAVRLQAAAIRWLP